MSAKRKNENTSSGNAQKKSKVDFFAPRTAQSAGNTSGPTFRFESKQPDTTRLTTWNVNGIQSVDQKMLRKYLDSEDPDILILTETRCSKVPPDIICLKTRYKYSYWGTDGGNGAGIAILSKNKPLNKPRMEGLPGCEQTLGRYIELEFEYLFLVGTYVPNSGDELQNLDKRAKWNAALTIRLRELDALKPIIWAGDFNCIPDKKDVDKKARTFWDRMGGLTEVERRDFRALLDPADEKLAKFTDVWRKIHPEAEKFTHSSEKFGAWRLDSFIMSQRILDKAIRCDIRHELEDLKLSDHWPVTLDLKEAV